MSSSKQILLTTEKNGIWMMDENEMKQDQCQNTLASTSLLPQLACLLCCMCVSLPTSLLICLSDLRCSNCLLLSLQIFNVEYRVISDMIFLFLCQILFPYPQSISLGRWPESMYETNYLLPCRAQAQ
eukprot:scaffold12259_cov119-Skeletonema_marinoi.AAC.1